MKSLKLQSILLLAFALLALPSFGQGLKAFKLKNGLSVYIWEDNTKSDVYGIVACRTGSVNDPAEYTGLAHYLEHVMFKGTDKIGALDWEKEKPIYEQIIAKYDEMAEETDPLKKEAIGKEINDLTVEEGKISVSNEFMNLIESMGGKGLNAGTSYDVTYSPRTRSTNGSKSIRNASSTPYSACSRPSWKVCTRNIICIRTTPEAYNASLYRARHSRDIPMRAPSSACPNT